MIRCDMLFVLPNSQQQLQISSSQNSSAIQTPKTPSSVNINISTSPSLYQTSNTSISNEDAFSDPKPICANDITNQIITKGELWNKKTVCNIYYLYIYRLVILLIVLIHILLYCQILHY